MCRSEGSHIIKLKRGWQNRILTTHTTYKTKGMDLFVLKPHKLLGFHLKVQTKEKEISLCVHIEETTIIPLDDVGPVCVSTVLIIHIVHNLECT